MKDQDPIAALEAALERAGSQNQLAREIGMPQAYISQVLSRSRPPSEKLLSALGFKRVVVKVGSAK